LPVGQISAVNACHPCVSAGNAAAAFWPRLEGWPRVRLLHPSFETLAEFIIGPRFARTRWQAPQDDVFACFASPSSDERNCLGMRTVSSKPAPPEYREFLTLSRRVHQGSLSDAPGAVVSSSCPYLRLPPFPPTPHRPAPAAAGCGATAVAHSTGRFRRPHRGKHPRSSERVSRSAPAT
jgi:hypothetical protein